MYDEIKNWVREQLSNDIAGIVIHGTTSESPNLDEYEKMQIIKCVISEYESYYSENSGADVKMIIIGAGTNSTQTTLNTCFSYKNYCHALMIAMPYYNKPPQRGIVSHFKTIATCPGLSDKLILLYNVPGRTGVNCLPDTVRQIVEACPNVLGLKEASGNVAQTKEIIDLCAHTKLKVFSGDDKIVVDMLNVGAKGLISVASNVFPQLFCTIVNKYLKLFRFGNYPCCEPVEQDLGRCYCVSEYESSKSTYDSNYVAELCDAMFCESNPIPVKRMMTLSGRYTFDTLRLPLVPLDTKLDDYVKAVYEKVKAREPMHED